MNFPGHNIGGIISSICMGGYIMYSSSNVELATISAITTYIFSLYPDMDIRSTSRTILTIIGLIGSFILFIINPYFCLLLLGLILFPRLLPHRGFNHSILMMLICAGIWDYIIPFNVFIPVIAGFSTHLLLDTHFKIV